MLENYPLNLFLKLQSHEILKAFFSFYSRNAGAPNVLYSITI
jgi:hypothetical protein